MLKEIGQDLCKSVITYNNNHDVIIDEQKNITNVYKKKIIKINELSKKGILKEMLNDL